MFVPKLSINFAIKYLYLQESIKMINKLLPLLKHLLVIIGFMIIALIYFYPTLQGKEIIQTDNIQYKGMAKQMNDYRSEYGKETYWIDSAFGGMPTYQLGANYPYNYVKRIDRIIRFLPRPADYLFLYLVCFYFLAFVLTNDLWISILSSLAFGFSTYLIVILGVGHNAKAHAIAYMPLVLAGILLVFKKKYLFGFLVSTIALSLEIVANHFQMTYYLLLMVLILGICLLMDAILKKQLKHFFVSISILLITGLLSFGLNSTNILATQQYTQDTTRGKSDLTIKPDGSPKESSSGLSKEYITQWSYGISETFNLLIPRFMGGSNSEKLDSNSSTYNALLKLGASPNVALNIVQTQIPTYWGEQPGVSGPAYIGATVLLIFLISLFLVEGKYKWWIVGSSLLCLLLSYGHNFELLTNFFIDYVPLYNKFRAVTSIQTILELAIPVLTIFGLSKLFDKSIDSNKKNRALKYSFFILSGIIVFLVLFKSSLFEFANSRELKQLNSTSNDLLGAFIEDRKALFSNDAWRSLVLIGICSIIILAYLKNKISSNLTFLFLGSIMLFDLIPVDLRYVNDESFTSSRILRNYFQPTQADKEILKDTSNFRVFDLSSGFFSGKASYYHNSIGGYHAAQPKRIQNLYEFYLAKGNQSVLNMLNIKYIITSSDNGSTQIVKNEEINGNAWFVDKLSKVSTADDEILALNTIDTKTIAVVQDNIWQNYIENNKQMMDFIDADSQFKIEGSNEVHLIKSKQDRLKYNTKNLNPGFLVFSENYYQPGWQAYIDGKPVDHIRVDYTLRGLIVPKGNHTIEFIFQPKVIQTGSIITNISLFVFVIIIVGYFLYKRFFQTDRL